MKKNESLKMQPGTATPGYQNARTRITNLFFELLERQFVIISSSDPLKLKTASDYAQCLSIHVNHLNHALREVTGNSTSYHISERIIKEAKSLLLHTDWPVSEIAYSLGFEYPTYFINFFKKNTGQTPKSVRQ